MSTDLIIIENLKPLEVFGTKGGLDPIIEKIKAQVRAEVPDISTKEGRLRIGSMAKKIGSAKVTLQDMAMGLTEDWRAKTAQVNAEKKRMTEELDALRDEIRAPLDAFNEREKLRIEERENRITEINNLLVAVGQNPEVANYEACIERADALFDFPWQEFAARATETHDAVLVKLQDGLEARKKHDAEQAELKRLREAEEARLQKERDDKIAADAAAKAKADAEAKAAADAKAAQEKADREKAKLEADKKAEADRAAKAEADRIAAENKAAADKKAAEERHQQELKDAQAKAKRDADAAAQAERDKQAAAKKAEEDAQAKRDADKKHKEKINRSALAAVMQHANLSEKQGQDVLTAIIKGLVPNVKITY